MICYESNLSSYFIRLNLISEWPPGIMLIHKKVLLRERKRHTARHLASARYAALSNDGGFPIQSWTGGYSIPGLDEGAYPIQFWMGYPRGTPVQTWDGYPPSKPGTGYSPMNWMEYPHLDLGWGTPSTSWMGYPTWTWDGYPPA